MNEKILIVDDEPDILETLYNVLSEEDYEVTKALGGKKAVELFKSNSFDLVITDLKMPETDGIEVMKQIRAIDDRVEIIVLTGFASLETAVKALRDYNAYDYLNKPLGNIDEIVIAAQRALERRSLLQKNKELVQALKKANYDLENRVKMRTEELTIANKELREAREISELALRAKNDFLSCMGHEFFTPLNHIIGFCHLLDELGGLDETQDEYLKIILNSSQNIASLVQDILHFSSAYSGKMTKINSRVNVKTILDKSLAVIHEKALEKGISISVETGNIPETISADEYKLRQILYNLLSNAVKFTPKGGTLHLKSEPVDKDSMLKISIEDNGIGIKEEDIDRIFNPFEQADKYLTRRHGGAGLGLYLAKKMVELHGGRLWVESEGKGKGAMFSFVIPAE
ncbi:Two component system response regulator/histidine kinase [Desulfonema limicola]|uniref:histidine kinase n=1 Tax=Desulfonema limicola TaxID=45656 RepID=A0A975BA19_9BACT|nr:ATP-binding protein [Desulfonema limicola]QTA81736.1 Two component system response regulator/histidine kinase [Desulfonema limicola]